MKSILKLFFRIDIFNRVLVIISLIMFTIIPSYELYFLKTDTIEENMILLFNLIFLISLAGNGFLAIYKPTRLPWFFFLDILFLLLFYFDTFTNKKTIELVPFNIFPLYITEIVLTSVGLAFNLLYLVYFLINRKRYKSENNEYTNSDTFYNFLNATPNSKAVEEKMNDMNKKENIIVKFTKKYRLSRTSRVISYLFFVVIFFFYLFKLINNVNILNKDILLYPLITSIIVTTILFIASLFFPRDYKYSYYFNSALYLIVMIFISRQVDMNPTLFIIAIVILLESLIVTMITEGRTWMGGKYDQ